MRYWSPDFIAQYYDSYTPRFVKDHGAAIVTLPYHRAPVRHAQIALERINPPRDSLILDAGCGVGLFANVFAYLRADLRMIGVTLSEYQVALAAEGANTLGTQDRVKFMATNYQSIPIPAESIDGAILFESIGYAALDRTFQEMSRIVRRGGFVFINDFAPVERDLTIMETYAVNLNREGCGYAFTPIAETLAIAERFGFVPITLIRNTNNQCDVAICADRANKFRWSTIALPENLPDPFKGWECKLVKQ